jgi:O-antigen ligase
MTALVRARSSRQAPAEGLPGSVRSADATTILAIFVALQFVLPSKLVMNGLPLDLSAASLVALGLGVFWFCTQMTTTLGAAKGRSPVRTMLFAYGFALLASYMHSASGYLPGDERSIGDHAMVTTFALICVALATVDGVRSRDRLYFLLSTMVICGSAVAMVGIVQFLLAFDLTPFLRPPGMHFTVIDPLVLDRSGLRRVAGTTAHPIELGVLCAMMLPLAIHLAFRARDARRGRGLWWTCVLLLGSGLMFSVSRSAILAAVCAGLVLLVGWPARRRRWRTCAGLGFLVVVKFASPGLLGTFVELFQNAGNDPSIKYRTHDYATAGELISQNLWLGRGIGTWYAPKRTVFDNQYLLTLVDSGVIGLVTLIGIFVAGMYSAGRVLAPHLRSRQSIDADASDRDLALSLIASLAVVLPSFATFDFAAFSTVSALAFLLAGAAGALLRVVGAEAAGERPDVHAIV